MCVDVVVDVLPEFWMVEVYIQGELSSGLGDLDISKSRFRRKKKTITKRNYESESDDGEELRNTVAFITFESSCPIKSVLGSISFSGCASESDCDNDDETFDLAENYEKISQLIETQKSLKMLINGTNHLDHILSIWKSDRFGLGFQGKSSKAEDVFVSAGKTKVVAMSATEPKVKVSAENATNRKIAVKTATNMKTASTMSIVIGTASGKVSDLKTASQQKFRHVCHHCSVVPNIRLRCFKLLREKNKREQAYGMRCHSPICYSCGVQGHIRRDYFKYVQRSNHGGLKLKNTWSRRFDHYVDEGMGFCPNFRRCGSSY
ncbi:hypothetical protein N665_0383s0094 [Sinapis alba]|nr:hypothetical protein N665_0383s0094 [Sinapis alba]